MKPGLTFSNWYIRLMCSALIGLVVFWIVSNLNNSSSVNEEASSGVAMAKSDGILEISGNGKPPLATTIHGNVHTSILHNENSSDGSAGNAGAESTTTPINQSETLSSNFAGSDVQAKRNESEILLYRKRRYLLFPEGSSFQLVYDLIIPIVDYTNYAIMGVTVAVAWELPSKPPSEIEEEVRDKLNDGTLGLQRNDSINNIQYIDTKPLNQHMSNIIYVQPSEYGQQVPAAYTRPQMNVNNGYRPVFKSDPNTPAYYTVSRPNAEFKLKSINNRRVDPGPTYAGPVYVQRPPQRAVYQERVPEQQPQIPPRPKQHAVYHIMGKRSVATEHTDPHLEKLDRIHLRYHRSSRLALYPKLEAMFNKQGLNGTECILRALCEVGRRRHETEPGGLLTEIFRTIFTLPTVDDEYQRPSSPHPKHIAWDEAHSAIVSNCADPYPTCEQLMWNW